MQSSERSRRPLFEGGGRGEPPTSGAVAPAALAPESSGVAAPPCTPARLPERFTQLYQDTRVHLYGFLRVLLRDPGAIEDCLQETAIVAWKKMQPGWSDEDFRRFVFTCARFKALSWLKKNKPDKMMFSGPEVIERLAERTQAAAAARNGSPRDRLKCLRACVGALPPDEQELVWTRYRHHHAETLEQLAAARGKSMPAVYKQLERLRGALRACVEGKLRSLER